MRRGTPAAALLALLLAAPASAQAPAGAKPRVVVVTSGTDALSQGESLRLAHHAEQALTRSGRFEVIKLADAADADAARARQSRQAEADSAFQAGMQAYDALDTQKAVQLFDKAVKGYEQTDLSRNFPSLTRAWIMRIASHVANGENRVARAEVDRLLPVSPKAEFSSRYFPPEELAYVEKVRRTIGALSTSALLVKSAPGAGQVYVDGVFRGLSPAAVNKIPPADHYVTVLAPGYALQQERARDGTVEVTLKPAQSFKRLQDLRQRISSAPRGEDRDDAARELGQWLGVNQVLVAVASKSPTGDRLEVVGLRLEVADGHNLAYAERALPLGEPLGAAADAFFDELSVSDAPRAGGPVTHYSAARWTRQKSGYVLLGTGAALLGGALASALHARNEQRLFQATPQVDVTTSDGHRRGGQTFAVLADVFALTGVVAAGTGTYLALSGGGGGESEPARAEPAKPVELPMPPPPEGTTPRKSTPDHEKDLREE